jgi:undecaprenyl diphosphate synthase
MSNAEALTANVQIGEFAVPRHVAIIMDGNGRWAAARGLPRTEGHRRGVEALRRTVRAAGDLGIGILTIFSFSSENWSRPPSEIRDLMGLLRRFIRNDLLELRQNGVHVRVIGERDDLEPEIRRLLEEAEELTKDNDKLTLVVAFNYGGRQEIARAAQRLAVDVAAGRLPASAITAERLAASLDAPDLPDPDLIIRTSGEQRLSNFLLWQAAYSELVFVPTYWPDFDRAVLEGAIAEYRRRERRFGGLIAKTGS